MPDGTIEKIIAPDRVGQVRNQSNPANDQQENAEREAKPLGHGQFPLQAGRERLHVNEFRSKPDRMWIREGFRNC